MMQPTICVDCGAEFMGGPGAERCQPCKAIRKRVIRGLYKAKRKARYDCYTGPKRVEVIYRDGGVDRYGENTFKAWLQAGAFQPGDEYVIDGQRHVVCNAQQEGV